MFNPEVGQQTLPMPERASHVFNYLCSHRREKGKVNQVKVTSKIVLSPFIRQMLMQQEQYSFKDLLHAFFILFLYYLINWCAPLTALALIVCFYYLFILLYRDFSPIFNLFLSYSFIASWYILLILSIDKYILYTDNLYIISFL